MLAEEKARSQMEMNDEIGVIYKRIISQVQLVVSDPVTSINVAATAHSVSEAVPSCKNDALALSCLFFLLP